MKWYNERLDEIKSREPMISACGDNCSLCPRYLARSDEELHETAVFWYKIGWRDRIVSNEEIRCGGCGSTPGCGFMILPCQKEMGVSNCRECARFCCDRLENVVKSSEENEADLRELCDSNEEAQMLRRYCYEKRKNLGI